jgi:hypothetical protein
VLLKNSGIFRGGTRDPFLAVLEDVDIAGVTQGFAIQRCTAADIALRIAV